MDSKRQGGDLFIVDNSDPGWKVLSYLREWVEYASSFDIATGNFEIGSLLALDRQWQKLDSIRILMGGEVSKRTKAVLLEGIQAALDASFEQEKDANPFLTGAPAIVEALRAGRIRCRVYTKDKFHAKAYITHAKSEVIGSAALVGSSNFTLPGLKDNVELNLQIRREVGLLQEWYERHWLQAEDVTAEVLKVAERHVRDFLPFEVYAKSLHELFRGQPLSGEAWLTMPLAQGGSRMYPRLDHYQREGFHALLKIAGKYDGAFLCDGVGLGKTFIGLMLIEWLLHARKRVALFVPKTARKPVWEDKIARLMPGLSGPFSNLMVFNHTDLLREANAQRDYPREMQQIKEMADVIIVDEAHHFRNPGAGAETGRMTHYRKLFDIAEGKTLFLLTATPVNNRLLDLQHMIELFSRKQPDYFKDAPLGIHSLPGHFRKMEKDLENLIDGATGGDGLPRAATNQAEAQQVLVSDSLFRHLVVQRSRAYVKASQVQHAESQALFPTREDPKVQPYDLKATYGRLLKMIETAFAKDKPLFSLAMYYPLGYHKDPASITDVFEENRQKQVVGLIRTQFLKRFESSVLAFEMSCKQLLDKLLAFARVNSDTGTEKKRLERWRNQHEELTGEIAEHERTLWDLPDKDESDEDVSEAELDEEFAALSRDEYKVEEILSETFLDLDQIVEFLHELRKFKPDRDDKLRALLKLLRTDAVLKKHKVLIFTEYMATARYLKLQLAKAGIEGVDEVDSAVDRDRGEIIRQFAPYYNESSTEQLSAAGLPETRVLISTDVLSEGLNLQDATRLINYDLHWNPVRLMQRIGRVDRRMDADVEKKIIADHPDRGPLRGRVAYWNFLPPAELDTLLKLYRRVSNKTLQIAKTLGIEGKKLLRPDDDYDALRDFNHQYEGATTPLERLRLEYQKLLRDYPDLAGKIKGLPNRIFAGRAHPAPGTKAVFFCYALPGPARTAPAPGSDSPAPAITWTEDAGQMAWYLYEVATGKIAEEPPAIADTIRSAPDTPRQCVMPQDTLREIRGKVEKHIKQTYLKAANAPVTVKPLLKAWMELS